MKYKYLKISMGTLSSRLSLRQHVDNIQSSVYFSIDLVPKYSTNDSDTLQTILKYLHVPQKNLPQF